MGDGVSRRRTVVEKAGCEVVGEVMLTNKVEGRLGLKERVSLKWMVRSVLVGLNSVLFIAG